MIEVPIKPLLETGVHFGHQPRRWNPKMEPYIFTERKGVHIIDLEQTMESIKKVTEMVSQRVAEGEEILFVGTKRQAQESLEEEARRCGMPYVNHRWLGGTLTNFKTIRKSVDKLKELERMEEEDIMERLSNKEARRKERERKRLLKNLEGIRDMESLPDMLFITDLIHEDIAVREAQKLGIPIVGILDTNCDPDDVDYGIPGNDDAIRALGLYSEIMADAVLEGKEIRQKRIAEEQSAVEAEEVEEEEATESATDQESAESSDIDEEEIVAEVQEDEDDNEQQEASEEDESDEEETAEDTDDETDSEEPDPETAENEEENEDKETDETKDDTEVVET